MDRNRLQELVYAALGEAMVTGGGTLDDDKVTKIGARLVEAIAGREILGAGLSPAACHALVLSGVVAAMTREPYSEERWNDLRKMAGETMRLGWKER